MQRKRHTYIAALSAKSDAFDDMHRQSLQCRGRVAVQRQILQEVQASDLHADGHHIGGLAQVLSGALQAPTHSA